MTPDRDVAILHVGVLPLWSDQGDAIHTREMGIALREVGVGVVHLNRTGPPAPPSANHREIRVAVVDRRFLRQLSWNLRATVAAVKAVHRENLDVVYTRLDPGMIVGLAAARLTRRPLVVEINGLPSEDVRLYRPSNAPLRWLTVSWERLMYGAAARIVGAPGYLEYVREKFAVASHRLCEAPLGVNPEVFAPRDRADCRRRLDLDDRPTVVWSGQLQGWQGLSTLIHAADLVRREIPSVRFLIVGDGGERGKLERLVTRRRLSATVRFEGRVPYAQVQDYQGCADVCVATFPGDRGRPGAISSLKVMTYLATGRPVVTSDMDEMGAVIRDAEAGDSVPPDDPEALARALIRLLAESEATWRDRCIAARRLAESRTWRHKAERVGRMLRELVR